VELFLSKDRLEKFIEKADDFPTLTYHALNTWGDSKSNLPEKSVTAVTWGVFPGREVIQPTIVDSESFNIWKDEAFALWRDQWGALYPADSTSRKLMDQIYENYWLLNIVENDFVDGNIFQIFQE